MVVQPKQQPLSQTQPQMVEDSPAGRTDLTQSRKTNTDATAVTNTEAEPDGFI